MTAVLSFIAGIVIGALAVVVVTVLLWEDGR